MAQKQRSSILALSIVVALVAVVVIWDHRATSPATPASSSDSSGLPPVKESWTYNTGVPWQNSANYWRTAAVGSDGTVYALGERQIFALSASGELKWRYPDSGLPRFGPLLAALIADDGAVWGATKMGWLIRLDAAGQAQPQFGGAGVINQMALSSSGVLLVCGDNMSNTIATAGYPKEPSEIAGAIGPNLGALKSAAFGRDNVLTIAEDTLTSWPLDFGQPNWRRKIGWGCHQPVIANDGTIYVACSDGIQSVNADGSDKWSFPTKFPTSAVIAENGVIFFSGIIDGNVYSLDPDGHLRWIFPAGKPLGSTPALSRAGVIYVGTQDGHLYALDSAGTPVWVLKTNGALGSPTISPDGTVYVQSADGLLHAIAQPQNGGLAGQWPKLDANENNNARAQ